MWVWFDYGGCGFVDDIEVLLYEDKQENSASTVNLQPWSAKGRFGPNDVHHQVGVAITCIHYINMYMQMFVP